MTTRIGAAINRITTVANQIIESSFPDECSITRPGTSLGDYGTAGPSYSTVAASIGCSWGPLSKTAAMEYVRAGQINEVCNYTVTMPSVVNGSVIDIKPKDRIVTVARGAEIARAFEVKGIIRNAGLPLTILCTLEEQ